MLHCVSRTTLKWGTMATSIRHRQKHEKTTDKQCLTALSETSIFLLMIQRVLIFSQLCIQDCLHQSSKLRTSRIKLIKARREKSNRSHYFGTLRNLRSDSEASHFLPNIIATTICSRCTEIYPTLTCDEIFVEGDWLVAFCSSQWRRFYFRIQWHRCQGVSLNQRNGRTLFTAVNSIVLESDRGKYWSLALGICTICDRLQFSSR